MSDFKKKTKDGYVTVDFMNGDNFFNMKETPYGTFHFPGTRALVQHREGVETATHVGYFFLNDGRIIRKPGTWKKICDLMYRIDYKKFLGAEFYRLCTNSHEEVPYSPTEDEFDEFMKTVPARQRPEISQRWVPPIGYRKKSRKKPLTSSYKASASLPTK